MHQRELGVQRVPVAIHVDELRPRRDGCTWKVRAHITGHVRRRPPRHWLADDSRDDVTPGQEPEDPEAAEIVRLARCDAGHRQQPRSSLRPADTVDTHVGILDGVAVFVHDPPADRAAARDRHVDVVSALAFHHRDRVTV
jgi:hypothetical protein